MAKTFANSMPISNLFTSFSRPLTYRHFTSIQHRVDFTVLMVLSKKENESSKNQSPVTLSPVLNCLSGISIDNFRGNMSLERTFAFVSVVGANCKELKKQNNG